MKTGQLKTGITTNDKETFFKPVMLQPVLHLNLQNTWDKIFKNGTSKIATNFTWPILKYFVPYQIKERSGRLLNLILATKG